jgi:hypothetical protein
MASNDDIKDIKASIEAAKRLTATHERLTRQHEKLTVEHQQLTYAIQSRPEIVANMERLVDERAAQWASDHGRSIAQACSSYLEERGTAPTDRRTERVQPRLPDFPTRSGAVDFHTLCGLVPELMKARLRIVLDGVGDEFFGLAPADRAARLTELEAQIASLEARHTELVDAAAGVGITLALLPPIQEQRDEQARAEARELARERARAEAMPPDVTAWPGRG